jgi:phosphoribulokinase
LLGYTTRAMRDCYDVKIYLDPEEDLRRRWKIGRDTTKRGYSEAQVIASLEKRKDDSPAFIHPQRMFADIIIRFQAPPGEKAQEDVHLDVLHILRPTLPHPDFTKVIEASGNGMLSLELTRDNGKPVDVLEINGAISDRQATRIEDYLWSQIPEASYLREMVGRIPGSVRSHPLALTQLLVAYHMVKAALGEHAL